MTLLPGYTVDPDPQNKLRIFRMASADEHVSYILLSSKSHYTQVHNLNTIQYSIINIFSVHH